MLNAFKSIDLDAFPADVQAAILAVREQVSGIVEQNAVLTTQVSELEALNARLEHFVKELNQVIYGARSEKITKDERQLAFEDIEVAQSEAEVQTDTIEMPTPRKKRKPAQRNLGNLPDHCCASVGTRAFDRRWFAYRRHIGPCQRIQIRRPMPVVPPVPDIRKIRW